MLIKTLMAESVEDKLFHKQVLTLTHPGHLHLRATWQSVIIHSPQIRCEPTVCRVLLCEKPSRLPSSGFKELATHWKGSVQLDSLAFFLQSLHRVYTGWGLNK